jgi:hypothetical protein
MQASLVIPCVPMAVRYKFYSTNKTHCNEHILDRNQRKTPH